MFIRLLSTCSTMVPSPLTSGRISFKITKMLCYERHVKCLLGEVKNIEIYLCKLFLQFLLKEAKTNDFKTGEIKNIREHFFVVFLRIFVL